MDHKDGANGKNADYGRNKNGRWYTCAEFGDSVKRAEEDEMTH
jgi:hypothetical protein